MKDLNKYNTAIDLSKLSEDEYFELYALTNIIYMGGIVIDTSPVLKIEEGEIHTMYSVYEIEEV